MGRVAAAIDLDRDAMECERIADGHEEGYRRAQQETRRQVEEAVEQGRYTAETVRYTRVEGETPHYRGEPRKNDVLDVEPFLEALGAIFGERAEGESERQKAGLELLAWYRGDTGEEAFPTAIARICGVRVDPPWTEHEPAHDRRERESARNEDRGGRVEGVDR